MHSLASLFDYPGVFGRSTTAAISAVTPISTAAANSTALTLSNWRLINRRLINRRIPHVKWHAATPQIVAVIPTVRRRPAVAEWKE
jgi:hypothetical protein